MYMSYRIEKEGNSAPTMFPSSRPSNLNLGPPPNFTVPSQYHPADFPSSFHGHGAENHLQAAAWPSHYAPARDDWSGFALAPPGTIPTSLHSAAGQMFYASPDFGGIPPPSTPVLQQLGPSYPGPALPGVSLKSSSFELVKKISPSTNTGKTRTKDKYRVVYSDYQRLELEKEFQANRFITIRRKSELATHLSLSERQVKIWFQNRRAKERKVNKKLQQQGTMSATSPPAITSGLTPLNNGVNIVNSSSNVLV
uniref:homeobox protein CDX-1-like n=1 Tax=Myxine glutinosa TaxID=7769 RepID=UPI00358F1377